MPRAGLDTDAVVAAAAALADEVGLPGVTMARLAERLGVRSPSLYKHVGGQDDLVRRVAALALTEAGDAMGAAVQGRAGREALAAAARALRDFVLAHPGRYAATVGLAPTGVDDPVSRSAVRGLQPLEAVLRGYAVAPDDVVHALRALRSAFHGFAVLQATGGFQWAADVDRSLDRLVDLLDRGLRAGAVAPESVGVEAVSG